MGASNPPKKQSDVYLCRWMELGGKSKLNALACNLIAIQDQVRHDLCVLHIDEPTGRSRHKTKGV